ncbi:hypothetical protein RJ639_030328 [Escallonia herrerae]|uniref:Pentatricopeptide repeat-containing protein n=1 Tax=Escallonia herrerae TaxID=1293975 RepID=A0AA88XF80_9ASTE|nr:hypothetical protein RJ639_030328 [Escallonia herrerae]
MDYAVSIFHALNTPSSPAYNIMIRGLTLKRSPQEALHLFDKMPENCVRPDGFTFPRVLKACLRLRALEEGKQIHAQIVKSGFVSEGFVDNSLIHFYANCGETGVVRHHCLKQKKNRFGSSSISPRGGSPESSQTAIKELVPGDSGAKRAFSEAKTREGIMLLGGKIAEIY